MSKVQPIMQLFPCTNRGFGFKSTNTAWGKRLLKTIRLVFQRQDKPKCACANFCRHPKQFYTFCPNKDSPLLVCAKHFCHTAGISTSHHDSALVVKTLLFAIYIAYERERERLLSFPPITSALPCRTTTTSFFFT